MATVLIVDDLAANRAVLTTLLTHHGHRLLEAVDGREALAVVRAERPDLVISDVLMPVMDGYELVRLLRADPATSNIPVVFATAHYGEREARELALRGGVYDVLTKPVASADVLRVVALALAGEARTPALSTPPPLTTTYGREHLRLVTDKLSEKVDDLRNANARLRAVINIGLELASEWDPDRMLQNVCVGTADLFGATYVTLGLTDRDGLHMRRIVTCGLDAVEWIKAGDDVQGIFKRVVAERRVFRRDHTGGEWPMDLPPGHPAVEACLLVPVASPTVVYGWFCLVGNEGRSFTDEDEQLVIALAGYVGRIHEGAHFRAMAVERAKGLEQEALARSRAELAVGRERDRAQLYLDTAEVILLALDAEGRITLVNRFACSFLGWTADELIGQDFINMCVPVRLRNDTRAKLGVVLTGPDSSVVDNPIVTKSGEARLVEWRNTLLRDAERTVVGVLTSGSDLTERHQAAEATRTAEERMRFALESAHVGIWDMDYATGLVRWSEMLEAQHGLRPGTFDGTFESFVARIHPDDRASMLATVEGAMAAGADFPVDYRSVSPEGAVRWLSGAGRIHLGADGTPARGIGISLDVTERRTLEAQYQQAQKMEAIGQLAGGVAHDFNNLLTAILGYCDLLLDDIGQSDPRRTDIEEIRKAGVFAAGLTRQLLAFSRKGIIDPTLLDLNGVVGEMETLLGRLIREDVTIVLRLWPQPALVKADRGQVEQIVLNLALNARDAMPKGGTLTIETRDVELDEYYEKGHVDAKSGPYVVLTVTDSGTGMTSEVKARLFEPFFTTKEPGKGTGLGLATVYGVVARNGGFVNVYSELGQGTSFKVYFPRVEGAAPVLDQSQALPAPVAAVETVLVVEDEESLRHLARRLLERLGYTVLLAANTGEAFQLLETHASIDVLLTDVVMPGGNGPELARQMTERRPALKVVFMSGYTEESIVQHGVLKPGVAFVHKPFTADTIGRKLREVLDRGRAHVVPDP